MGGDSASTIRRIRRTWQLRRDRARSGSWAIFTQRGARGARGVSLGHQARRRSPRLQGATQGGELVGTWHQNLFTSLGKTNLCDCYAPDYTQLYTRVAATAKTWRIGARMRRGFAVIDLRSGHFLSVGSGCGGGPQVHRRRVTRRVRLLLRGWSPRQEAWQSSRTYRNLLPSTPLKGARTDEQTTTRPFRRVNARWSHRAWRTGTGWSREKTRDTKGDSSTARLTEPCI